MSFQLKTSQSFEAIKKLHLSSSAILKDIMAFYT